jgi:hypothetical protein
VESAVVEVTQGAARHNLTATGWPARFHRRTCRRRVNEFTRDPCWKRNSVNPGIPDPEIMRVQREGQDYKKLVMQQFHETRKPGTISTGSGSGFSGMHEGTPFGRHSFSYWDEKALVHKTLQFFDGQSIELMNRLVFSEDKARLSFSLEVSSGGKTMRYEDDFPVTLPK